MRNSFTAMPSLEPDHPLMGLHSFLAEVSTGMSNYADRAEKLADAQWDRNQLPGDVILPLGALAQELRDVRQNVRDLATKVAAHVIG